MTENNVYFSQVVIPIPSGIKDEDLIKCFAKPLYSFSEIEKIIESKKQINGGGGEK